MALNRLTAAGRQHVDDIEAAVKASGVRAVEIDIDPTTDTRIHQFGVLVAAPQATCVFGTIAPEEVTVDLGGITMEGGCVAGPGGH